MSGRKPRRGGTRRPRHARALVVLFLCAGIATLGLLAGGEHHRAGARLERDPMVGYYPEGMPRYPRVQEIPAGKNSQVGSTRVQMSFFHTEDGPAKVADYYSHHWRARRFFVREDVSHQGGVVSAVDAQNGRIYQALITVKDRHTVVFPSLTTSPMGAMDGLEQPSPIALFPESKAVIKLGSDEGNTGARVILSVNDGSLGPNVTHYRRVLREAGYREERPRKADKQPARQDQRILLYRKQDSEVTVNLSAMGPKRVRVHIMMVGS